MSFNEWETYKLGEICTKIGSGATPKGGKESYLASGEYSLIRSQNVLDYVFSYDGLAFINDEQASKLNNVTIEEDDVLLNITGDSVARVCQVPKNVLPARVNQHVAIIRPNKEILDSAFLKYYLLNPPFKALLLTYSSVGATRNAITKGMIEELDVTIPSIEQQNRIAHILTTIDDKIENNLATNQTLEEISRTLFQEWFVNFNYPGADGILKDSELGQIPNDWNVISLDTLMEFQGGSQPPSETFKDEFQDGYIRLIQIRDYEKDNHITFIPFTSRLKLCSKKDIMIARYGASVGRILFGLEGAYNVALVKVIPNKIYFTEFLRVYLKSNIFQERLIGMSGRSAQAGFNKDDFRSFKLAFPNDEDILIKFENVVSSFLDKILDNHTEIENLKNTRDSLLPKLMSGEIEVNG